MDVARWPELGARRRPGRGFGWATASRWCATGNVLLCRRGRSCRDVVVGGPGFVAVGGDNFAGSDDEARGAVWTSPDGQSWSRVPDDAQVFGSRQAEGGFVNLQGVAAAEDGRLVAVGVDVQDDGLVVGVALRSADGVSWTRAPHDEAVFASESSDTVIADVVAGGRGFVAVGSEATPAGSVFLVDPVVALQEARRQWPTSLGEVRGVVWTSRGRAGLEPGARGAPPRPRRGQRPVARRHDRRAGPRRRRPARVRPRDRPGRLDLTRTARPGVPPPISKRHCARPEASS